MPDQPKRVRRWLAYVTPEVLVALAVAGVAAWLLSAPLGLEVSTEGSPLQHQPEARTELVRPEGAR